MIHTVKTTHQVTKQRIVEVRWIVSQDHPWPHIKHLYNGWGGDDKIMSGGDLTPIYSAYLLSPDAPEGISEGWDRTVLSGYNGASSAFEVRGKPVGEVVARIRPRFGGSSEPMDIYYKAGYGDSFTPSARAVLEQGDRALLEYIEANRESLRVDAYRGIIASCDAALTTAYKHLETMVKQVDVLRARAS